MGLRPSIHCLFVSLFFRKTLFAGRYSVFGDVLQTQTDRFSIKLAVPYDAAAVDLSRKYKNQSDTDKLIKDAIDHAMHPTLESINYAISELGFNFGNNGDAPKRLTVDLTNTQGRLAWPIVGYSYLLIRCNHNAADSGVCGFESVHFSSFYPKRRGGKE